MQDKFLLRCVQFHLHHHWETVVSQFSVSEFDFYFCRCLIKTRFSDLQLELPLEMPANPFRTVK